MRRRSKSGNPLHSDAMNYIRNGYPVIPLGPKSKKPLYRSSGFKDASISEGKVKTWWSENPTANIGIATGIFSGIVVIDVDIKGGIDGNASYEALRNEHNIPDTRSVRTPSGGTHYYFSLPEGESVKCRVGISPGIDVRGTGGYIVAPPSLTSTGRYEWTDENVDIAPIPEGLLDCLNQTGGHNKYQHHGSTDNPFDGVPEGKRDDALFKYACRLKAKGLAKREIRELVLAAAENCDPPFPEREARKCVKSAWKYAPSFELTEVGNAERVVYYNQDTLRYIKNIGWMAWDETSRQWRIDDSLAWNLANNAMKMLKQDTNRDDDSVYAKAIEQHYKRSQTARSIKAVLEIASNNPEVRLSTEDIDNDPLYVQASNGVINLQTGILTDSRPEMYFTKQVPITYDSNASCPHFTDFLDEIFQGDDELIGYVRRAIGYSLTGSNKEQCMFLMYGRGANGKSVLQNILALLSGEYGVASPLQMLTQKNRSSTNDLARLQGKRLVTLSEEAAGHELDEALVKQLTGGDTIAARALYKEFTDFTVVAKFWMSTNHLPRVIGKDHAIWRRIKVIPFEYTVPEDRIDQDLLENLKNELPGILNWAIEGCREWINEGLGTCEAVEQATNAYHNESDPIKEWLEAKTYTNDSVSTNASDLHSSYLKHSALAGSEMSQTVFGKHLRKRGYTKYRRNNGIYYKGIGLKANRPSRRRRKKVKTHAS
ncbi:MAG: phage/plasmid primase, P4 family [Sedimenticola sp.]